MEEKCPNCGKTVIPVSETKYQCISCCNVFDGSEFGGGTIKGSHRLYI